MAAIIRPKPSYPLFQKSHPIAQGMVCYLGLTDQGVPQNVSGTQLNITESVNNIRTSYRKQTPAGTEWVGSPYGWAVDFTDTSGTGGNAERIDLGDKAGGSGGTDPLIPPLRPSSVSLGIIFNPTAFTNSYGNIASAWVLGNADPFIYYGLTFVATSAKVQFGIATGGAGTGTFISSSTISAGTWYIMVATYDQTTMKLYIDGKLDVSGAKSGAINTSSGRRFTLAGVPESTGTQTGKFKCAGLAIWDRALSQGEVAQWTSDPFEVIRPRTRQWRIPALVLSPSVSDSITVTENVATNIHTVTTLTKAVSDAITVADSASIAAIPYKLLASLNDTISVSEFVHAQEAYERLIFDSINVSENFRSLYPILSGRLFESISISESTARSLAIRRIQINVNETITLSEFIKPLIIRLGAHPSDNTLVSEFVKTSMSLYVKLSENISVAEEILPVLPQVFIRILTDHQITVSDNVAAQLITFQSKLHLLSYIRRYLNDVVNAPPQSFTAIDPAAPEFIDNSGGFDWEVQKTDLTDYLRRYLNDVVQ